jgi:hypothetical protein
MYGWRDTRIPFVPLEVVKNYLEGEQMYQLVMSFLGKLSFDTQPLPDEFGLGMMPLWSRVWWDRNAMESLRKFRESRSPFLDKGA